MVVKFEKLVLLQRWKMLYLLIAYVSSSVVAIVIAKYLVPYLGGAFSILVGVLCALAIGWLLSRIVSHSALSRCPVCHSSQLAEMYKLQCQIPEYQCGHCQRVFSDKE